MDSKRTMSNFKTAPELTLVENRLSWTDQLYRAIMTAASPGGSNARLSVLIYHRVLQNEDPLFPEEVHARVFDTQINFLRASFNIIPLAEGVRGLREGRLPSRAACITFDDGYADNAKIALPILRKYGVPATFFIATGFLDGGRMWNDSVIELVRAAPGGSLDLSALSLGTYHIETLHQRQLAIFTLLDKLKYLPMRSRQEQIDRMCGLIGVPLPNDLMMTTEQIRELHSAGMEIGGHTVNHPILARLELADARNEIAAGKETLEHIIHGSVRLFAYPNGKPNRDYRSDHVSIVKDLGFEGAVSTAWGAARIGNDLYQLPRFTPWDKRRLHFNVRLVRNMLRKVEIAVLKGQNSAAFLSNPLDLQ